MQEIFRSATASTRFQRLDPPRRQAYLGCERSGLQRLFRGQRPAMTPFVAAVQTNEQGHAVAHEAHRRGGLASHRYRRLGEPPPRHRYIRSVSDGLACFHGENVFEDCVHQPTVVGSGKAAVERPEIRRVNPRGRAISRTPCAALLPDAIRPKYAQRYLSEFEYRFNRRFDLPDRSSRDGTTWRLLDADRCRNGYLKDPA